MRRAFWLFILSSVVLLKVQAIPPSFPESEGNDEDDYYDRVGLSTSKANYSSLSSSMIAWGVGLAAGITALTLLIDPSTSGGGGGGGGGGHSGHTH